MITAERIILIIAIAYNITMSLTIQTSNFKSSLLFKAIPFFIGLGLIFVLCLTEGWIVI